MRFSRTIGDRVPIPTKETLGLMLKCVAIVAVALAVFHQDLSIVFNDALREETSSYVVIIPFIVLYFIYRKRKMIKAATRTESMRLFGAIPVNLVAGVLLFMTSLQLYWFGSYTFTPLDYHMLVLPFFVCATILILFNTRTMKELVIPALFLFLLVPPPAEVVYNLGSALSIISSEIAYRILRLVGFGVTLVTEGGTPTIGVTQQSGSALSFQVDVACSGIYSQIGFVVFALFMACIVRDKLWKKPLLFIVGLPLIYFLNVLRIVFTVTVGYYQGMDLALDVFHSLSGWVLIFAGTILLLAVSEKVLKIRIVTTRDRKCPTCEQENMQVKDFCHECGRIRNMKLKPLKKTDVSKIAALVLTVVLIVSIQVPVFALAAGPPEIVTQGTQGGSVSTTILPTLPDYTLQFERRDTDFERIAQQDASLVYAYHPLIDSEDLIYVTIEIAEATKSLHRWETCLITSPLEQGRQPSVQQIELSDIQLIQNPPIFGRYFAFQYAPTGQIQQVLYWYETSQFQTNTMSETKHVKISVIAYPDDSANIPQLKTNLARFAVAIAQYWQPLKTWSQVAITISQDGDKLAMITVAILIAVLFLAALETLKAKNQGTKAYQKWAESNKAVADAVSKGTGRHPSTLNRIVETYNQMNVVHMNAETMLGKLSEAQKNGLVEEDVVGVKDEPVKVWRIR